MSIALSTTLDASFDETVARTRQALADQGFGVLTEIDVKATMKNKLDEDVEDYLILGACNPSLAHRAIGVNRQIGSCCRATSSCGATPRIRVGRSSRP